MNAMAISLCMCLAGGRGNWTTDGCELTGNENGVITCACDHLTNFAILVVCSNRKPFLEFAVRANDILLSTFDDDFQC